MNLDRLDGFPGCCIPPGPVRSAAQASIWRPGPPAGLIIRPLTLGPSGCLGCSPVDLSAHPPYPRYPVPTVSLVSSPPLPLQRPHRARLALPCLRLVPLFSCSCSLSGCGETVPLFWQSHRGVCLECVVLSVDTIDTARPHCQPDVVARPPLATEVSSGHGLDRHRGGSGSRAVCGDPFLTAFRAAVRLPSDLHHSPRLPPPHCVSSSRAVAVGGFCGAVWQTRPSRSNRVDAPPPQPPLSARLHALFAGTSRRRGDGEKQKPDYIAHEPSL